MLLSEARDVMDAGMAGGARSVSWDFGGWCKPIERVRKRNGEIRTRETQTVLFDAALG